MKSTKNKQSKEMLSWKETVSKFINPDLRRSWWQVVNTLVPYFILMGLMVRSLEVSYWLVFALAVPTAGFVVRIFIIFHDCGHGSFFKSRRLNSILGYVTGLLTFTPHHRWWHAHAIHHATCSDLDRRGTGDIWTMTVQEYLGASKGKKLIYRVYRNPLVMFVVGPFIVFFLTPRFPARSEGKLERQSVHLTNLGLLVILLFVSLTIGLKEYILVQLPTLFFAFSAGVWMFYVQHQFEGVYWVRHSDWSFTEAALQGSSFYKQPKVFQWFTGNIGFHHIHHLNPRIPNYYLEKCHNDNPIFQTVKPITMWKSFGSLKLRLWAEEQQALVGFAHLKTLR